MKTIIPSAKELDALPIGTRVAQVTLPDEVDANFPETFVARIPSGQAICFLEFENHKEWQEFKKNRKLIISFPFGEVPPFLVGAYHAESEEDDNLGLEDPDQQNKHN